MAPASSLRTLAIWTSELALAEPQYCEWHLGVRAKLERARPEVRAVLRNLTSPRNLFPTRNSFRGLSYDVGDTHTRT